MTIATLITITLAIPIGVMLIEAAGKFAVRRNWFNPFHTARVWTHELPFEITYHKSAFGRRRALQQVERWRTDPDVPFGSFDAACMEAQIR